MVLSVKLALLAFLIRIFDHVYHKTIIGIRVFISVISMYYAADFFASVFICWPISAFWRGEINDCIRMIALSTVDAIVSVLTDVIILMIPLYLTWSLQLSKKKRLRVVGLLSAGGTAAAFSIYRLVITFTLGQSENQTIVNAKVTMAIVAEVSIGVICSCLPAVSVLFVRPSHSSSHNEQQHHVNADSQRGIVVTSAMHAETTHGGENDDKVGSESGLGHQNEGCFMTSAQALHSAV